MGNKKVIKASLNFPIPTPTWISSPTTLTLKIKVKILLTILQSYGIITGVIVVCILGFIFFRIAHILGFIHNEYGRLLIIGCLTYVTTQIVYHLLMLFGLVPFMSMTIPFISYGVFPMLLGSVAIGLTLSIYRRKPYV